MPRKSALALFMLLCLAVMDSQARGRHRRARGPAAPQKMFIVQVKQDGESVKETGVSISKGRPATDTPVEGAWYCEIQGDDGKVVWSGFLPNPLAAPEAKGTGEVRLPYQKAFTKAVLFKTVTGPVPMPDRGAPILSVALPQGG